MIENRELISKTPYLINRVVYQLTNLNTTVLVGGNSYICNCAKFDAKEF